MLAGLILLAAVAAPPRPPSLTTSVDDNLRYAVAAVCLPWIRSGDDSGLKVKGVWPFGWGDQATIKALHATGRLVGMAGRVNVGVFNGEWGRGCEIEGNLVDPTSARATVLNVLADAPEHFAPAAVQRVSGAWPVEDALCAAAPSTLGGLVSAAAPREHGVPRLLVTLFDERPRSARCDAPPPAP